jgi:hypothetical protein
VKVEISLGRCYCHGSPRQVGVDRQVEPRRPALEPRRPALDPAQHQMLDRVKADHATVNGLSALIVGTFGDGMIITNRLNRDVRSVAPIPRKQQTEARNAVLSLSGTGSSNPSPSSSGSCTKSSGVPREEGRIHFSGPSTGQRNRRGHQCASSALNWGVRTSFAARDVNSAVPDLRGSTITIPFAERRANGRTAIPLACALDADLSLMSPAALPRA